MTEDNKENSFFTWKHLGYTLAVATLGALVGVRAAGWGYEQRINIAKKNEELVGRLLGCPDREESKEWPEWPCANYIVIKQFEDMELQYKFHRDKDGNLVAKRHYEDTSPYRYSHGW